MTTSVWRRPLAVLLAVARPHPHDVAVLEALRECREAQRRLHRRTQEAESVAATVNGKTIEKLDIELALCKVERHQARQENAFMKNERKRLQSKIRRLEAELRRQGGDGNGDCGVSTEQSPPSSGRLLGEEQ